MGEMSNNEPLESLKAILTDLAKRNTISKEGGNKVQFWDTQCSVEAFSPHPDARQSLVYKPEKK